MLRFKKITDNAIEPYKASEGSAGFDLRSAYDIVIKSKDKALVKTDLQFQFPNGCYGRIAPRSGLAVKNFIHVGAGVIDPDYTGNVGVVLFNFDNQDFNIKKGDRIAQIICEKYMKVDLEEINDPEIETTERGSKGFGSSGTR